MEFNAPNMIRAGKDAVAALSGLEGVRALLVSDREAAEGAALRALHAAGFETRVLRVPVAAGMAAAEAGKKALMEFKPSWVVAAGAWGAINAAKLMRLFYEYPGLSAAEAAKNGAPERLRLTQMAALPLLSSGGAEATNEAVALVRGMREVVKGRSMTPDVVAVDSGLIAHSTEREYEKSAIVTLGMAIESASRGGTDFTLPLSLHAARIICEKTPSFAGETMNRENIANAQCLAGLAYANSEHCALFAFRRAHSALGAEADPAGETAIYLPRIIRADAANASYARMAREPDLPGKTQSELVESLAVLVEEYADMLGMPAALCELGLDRNEFLKNLPRAARAAAELSGISQEEAEALLRAAY